MSDPKFVKILALGDYTKGREKTSVTFRLEFPMDWIASPTGATFAKRAG